MLLADRGYDADWIRDLVTAKGGWANITPKSSRTDPIWFSPYLALVQLASIRLWLRTNESTP